MNQYALILDAPARARRKDPETAKEAARSVRVAELEAEVLAALHERGPSTSLQVAEHLGRDLVAVSPRLRPLANKGLVKDSGERALNPSGKKAIMWEAV